MKMMRVHVALWLILLIGGFALGFVPEYQKNRDLRAQLQDPQKTIDSLQLQVRMSELRDTASLMLLELSRQNYGLARDYADQYYNKLRDDIDGVPDPALKKALEDLASTRDSMTTALTSANPASLAAAQPIVSKTFELTRSLK